MCVGLSTVDMQGQKLLEVVESGAEVDRAAEVSWVFEKCCYGPFDRLHDLRIGIRIVCPDMSLSSR